MTRNPACVACGRDDLPVALTDWDARSVLVCSSCTAEVGTPPPPLTLCDRVYRAVKRNPRSTFGELCDVLELPEFSEGEEAAKQRDAAMAHLRRLRRRGAVATEGKYSKMVYFVADESLAPPRNQVAAANKARATSGRKLREYHRNRKKGKCTQCWAQMPKDREQVLCERCAEKRRQARKKNPPQEGQCTRCRCTLLPEWSGYKMCPECREIKAASMNRYRADAEIKKRINDEQRERDRLRRVKCKAEGLCIDCMDPAEPGKSRCDTCKKSHRILLADYRARRDAEPMKEAA